jgi:hypothetical protein
VHIEEFTYVVVYGIGIPFSLVDREFDGDVCLVDWVSDDREDPWVKVRPKDDTSYRVHRMNCFPLPKGYKLPTTERI